MPPKRKHKNSHSSDLENEVHNGSSEYDIDEEEEDDSLDEEENNDNNDNNEGENSKRKNMKSKSKPIQHRSTLGASNEQTRRTSSRKKQKPSNSESTDIQKLIQKNAELESKLRRAKIREGKAAQHNGAQDGLESEEETLPTMRLKPTATPLPSISTPKPRMLNLTQVSSKKQKKPSRNMYQSLVAQPSEVSPVASSPQQAMPCIPVSASNDSNSLFSETNNSSENIGLASATSDAGSVSNGETASGQTATTLPTLTLIGPVKGRAKASDYSNGGEALILRAIRDYEARIIGLGCFPDSPLQIKWAEECFQGACDIAKQTYKPEKREIKLITSRGSRIRSEAFNYIRTKVETCYRFDSSGNKKSIKTNRALYQTLSERNFSAFLYKERDPQWSGYIEHPAMLVFLRYIFESHMAMTFEGYFSTISLPTLACVCTMVRVSLMEWSTGKLEKVKKFSEQSFKVYYDAYLKDLELWHSMKPSVSLNIRRKMFDKVKAKCAGKTETGVTTHISGKVEDELRAQMEARTGDTSDESSDPGSDVDC
ncbi:hypothetical protein C8R42DRAFT_640181 [Lentinula raphanica]|nr:hypothetical protein C8R42DRAFT_640181 [Lentinula raphanica]